MQIPAETKPTSAIVEDPRLAETAAEILKAVAHPIRLQLVALLCGEPMNVSRLAEKLSVPQAIVSQQLRILRMKNLVGVTRENGFAVYWLAEEHLRTMLGCLNDCVCTGRAP